MAISTPCYATREDVKAALDIAETARDDQQIDRALESAARSIEGFLHRQFYPLLTTKYVDWPNWQYAYPWRIWLDQAELADVTTTVPVVTSGGNVIDASHIFWGNPRYAPPYTYLELNRSFGDSFGQGNTPQRDVAITGVFGYTVDTRAGGALAANVTTTTATTVTVTDGSAVGVGDNILVGSERMLVTGRANVTSAQTQQGSGCSTASAADDILAVTDGTKFFPYEVAQLDGERMLIVDVTGNNLTVKRAFDGTVLAPHTGATVYVSRQLTVTRGALGTTAATHTAADPVLVHAVPGLIRQLAVAEALNAVLQERGGYSRTQGNGASAQIGIGEAIGDLRASAYELYGRKARSRVV